MGSRAFGPSKHKALGYYQPSPDLGYEFYELWDKISSINKKSPTRLKSENADFASELIAAFDSKSARKEPVFQSTQKLALEDKHDLGTELKVKINEQYKKNYYVIHNQFI